eukprot:1335362-Alexandrium_andersonii.AAC.1
MSLPLSRPPLRDVPTLGPRAARSCRCLLGRSLGRRELSERSSTARILQERPTRLVDSGSAPSPSRLARPALPR